MAYLKELKNNKGANKGSNCVNVPAGQFTEGVTI